MKPSSPAGSPHTPDFVPSLPEIIRYFSGVVLLMAGRKEGLGRFNLTADGFWASFSAIIVALPPMALSWIVYELVEKSGPAGGVFAYAAHALADVVAWILPLLLGIMAAPSIGFGKKIGQMIITLNWAGALISWALVPLWLLMLLTGGSDRLSVLVLLISLATLFLTARVIVFSTGVDYLVATGITVLLVVISLLTYAAVTDLTGVQLL
ncbi:hypothetical protein FPY71_04420 [Aureimonas fodinaquatilis]|uniref:Transporter n=1 Tax=Aureimonas fodinaquatilis TaxID=2565783 RepID=A0A5B0E2J7_9HYPH|nr:hypothetical protein [Aureimonas fodinaquatilis]KAA0972345.1 hypothetical protein FPY71_04420 [Aureimonas fodinaquatilis]